MWNKIRILGSVLKLIKNPLATEEVFKISDLSRKIGSEKDIEATLANVRCHPSYAKLLNERYVPKHPTLPELLAMKDGSLGRALGDFLNKNSFDVNFYPPEDPSTEMGYLSLRMRQTHDLWHVLLGFEATIPGETGLQAFSTHQTKSPIAALLVVVGLVNTLLNRPNELPHVLGEISKGVRLARDSAFFLGVPWEKFWEMDLNELKAKYLSDSPQDGHAPDHVSSIIAYENRSVG